jgi:hypothetical protein
MSLAAIPLALPVACEPAPAVRVQTPAAVWTANALAAEHDYQDLDTAAAVYRIVAADRGWDQPTIDRREAFVRGVMQRESAGCYNLRRGAVFASHTGAGCALKRQGRGTDSGYGQVLMSVHKTWLCPQEGLCSPEDVTSTPYASMTAFLALIERAGSQGWCYTKQLRAGRLCRSWPG